MARSALRKKWTLSICALALLGGAGAGAQSYPSKPIQFIVNNSPGAVTPQVIDPRITIDVTRDFEPVIAIGSVDFFWSSTPMPYPLTGYPAVASQLNKGGTTLKILATGGARRSPVLPEVPTFAEAGVAGVEAKGGFMLLAPAGTPRNIIARINTEANKVLALPEVQADFARQAITVEGGTADELGRQMRADIEKWTRVIKAAGIKPE